MGLKNLIINSINKFKKWFNYDLESNNQALSKNESVDSEKHTSSISPINIEQPIEKITTIKQDNIVQEVNYDKKDQKNESENNIRKKVNKKKYHYIKDFTDIPYEKRSVENDRFFCALECDARNILYNEDDSVKILFDKLVYYDESKYLLKYCKKNSVPIKKNVSNKELVNAIIREPYYSHFLLKLQDETIKGVELEVLEHVKNFIIKYNGCLPKIDNKMDSYEHVQKGKDRNIKSVSTKPYKFKYSGKILEFTDYFDNEGEYFDQKNEAVLYFHDFDDDYNPYDD